MEASEGVNIVFGYSKEEVLKLKSTNLMPTLFARQHPTFVYNCKFNKSNGLYKHKRVICLHKFGHVFLANKYLKVLV